MEENRGFTKGMLNYIFDICGQRTWQSWFIEDRQTPIRKAYPIIMKFMKDVLNDHETYHGEFMHTWDEERKGNFKPSAEWRKKICAMYGIDSTKIKFHTPEELFYKSIDYIMVYFEKISYLPIEDWTWEERYDYDL